MLLSIYWVLKDVAIFTKSVHQVIFLKMELKFASGLLNAVTVLWLAGGLAQETMDSRVEFRSIYVPDSVIHVGF